MLAVTTGVAAAAAGVLRRRAIAALHTTVVAAEAPQDAAAPPKPQSGLLLLPYNNETRPSFESNELVFECAKKFSQQLTVWLKSSTQPDAAALTRFTLAMYDDAFMSACDANHANLQCTVLADCGTFGSVSGSSLCTAAAEVDEVVVCSSHTALARWAKAELASAQAAPPLVLQPPPDVDDCIVVDEIEGPLPSFAKVAVGGTFDHMHAGHRKLLAVAAAATAPSGELLIGVTGPALLRNKKHASSLQSYGEREGAVAGFLRSVAPALHFVTAQLQEPGGAAATDAAFEAIVVSTETVGGARWINARRAERGFPPLVILTIARRNSTLQSSTWLRQQADAAAAGAAGGSL